MWLALLAATAAILSAKEPAPTGGLSDPPAKVTRIHDREYRYVDEGTGPFVVLIHGARVAQGVWARQLPVLVKAGYRVICPYAAGMGGSEITGPMSTAKDADDVWALLDQLGAERIVVAGHSAGAREALQMLLEKPDRIAGIVLVDGSYALAGPAAQLGPERLTTAARKGYERYRHEFEELKLPWVYHNEFNLREYRAWAAMDPAFIERVSRRPDPRNRPLPSGIYCQVPMLVFASGWGKITAEDPEAAALRGKLPAKQVFFQVITESGHWVQIEQAELVNRTLVSFLEQWPLSGANGAPSQ